MMSDEREEWIEFNHWICLYGSAERALRVALEKLRESKVARRTIGDEKT